MIKNTQNVRDLALAALDESTLDQATGAGVPFNQRFDMLPPEPALGGGLIGIGNLDAGCPACGYLSSDIGPDLGALVLPKFGR